MTHTVATATSIPYIRGTSETIAHIILLGPPNIWIAHKHNLFTSRHLLTNVKDKDEPEDRPTQPLIYRWNWQKLNHKTKQIQMSYSKGWPQQKHCPTPLKYKAKFWLGLCFVGCQNISRQQQCFSGLQSPRWSFSIKVSKKWERSNNSFQSAFQMHGKFLYYHLLSPHLPT